MSAECAPIYISISVVFCCFWTRSCDSAMFHFERTFFSTQVNPSLPVADITVIEPPSPNTVEEKTIFVNEQIMIPNDDENENLPNATEIMMSE